MTPQHYRNHHSLWPWRMPIYLYEYIDRQAKRDHWLKQWTKRLTTIYRCINMWRARKTYSLAICFSSGSFLQRWFCILSSPTINLNEGKHSPPPTSQFSAPEDCSKNGCGDSTHTSFPIHFHVEWQTSRAPISSSVWLQDAQSLCESPLNVDEILKRWIDQWNLFHPCPTQHVQPLLQIWICSGKPSCLGVVCDGHNLRRSLLEKGFQNCWWEAW